VNLRRAPPVYVSSCRPPVVEETIMGTLVQDVRYGLRQLRRSPAFTITAVLALAVGIGATTTVFSVANHLVLRPVAAADPSSLARVYAGRGGITPYPDFVEYRARARTFASLTAFQILPVTIRDGDVSTGVWAEEVSGDYFRTLGIAAEQGRAFGTDDAPAAGQGSVAVLSHRFWAARFGADPGVVGRTLIVNGKPFTILGVMPAAFTGASQPVIPSFWVPITMDPVLKPGSELLTSSAHGTVHIIGRLAGGVPLAQAQAELATIAGDIQRGRPHTGRERAVTVEAAHTLPPYARTPVAAFMAFLLVVCFLAVIVACSNVATLLLARSAARRREMAVRTAVGAGRPRLLRQLLTEGMLLALGAGGLGLGLALAAARAIAGIPVNAPMPISLDVAPDWRVFLFALAVAAASTLVFALSPAWQASRADVVDGLRSGSGGGSGRGTSRTRSVFMTAQLAVSLVLLIVAGLCVQSLRSTTSGALGFDRQHVLAVTLDAGPRGYSAERAGAIRSGILDQLARTPGVQGAAFTQIVPLTLSSNADLFTTEGSGGLDRRAQLDLNAVSPGYFATVGIPLRAGRDFTAADDAGAPLVAIVNETLAREMAGTASPVGRTIRRGNEGRIYEIVGVAADASYVSAGESPRPFVYLSLAQQEGAVPTLLVRGAGTPDALAPAVRRVVAAVDPDLPVAAAEPLSQVTAAAMLPARAAGALLGICGILALLLAAIGIFGTASYMVRQRTREIGIRTALGAPSRAVVWLVCRQTLRWTAVGTILGAAAAAGASRIVASLVPGVDGVDPLLLVATAGLLSATAVAATAGPALKAVRIDPLVALRAD
jgi:predicted permease